MKDEELSPLYQNTNLSHTRWSERCWQEEWKLAGRGERGEERVFILLC
jgi:hypothetical protein